MAAPGGHHAAGPVSAGRRRRSLAPASARFGSRLGAVARTGGAVSVSGRAARMIITRPRPLADFATVALAALGHHTLRAGDITPGWSPDMLPVCLAALRETPAPHDRPLNRLADALGLSDAELLAAALCLAADTDPTAARAVAEAQAPIGGSRPLSGLLATVLAPLVATVAGLACGAAVRCGLLRLGDEPAALAERSL